MRLLNFGSVFSFDPHISDKLLDPDQPEIHAPYNHMEYVLPIHVITLYGIGFLYFLNLEKIPNW